MASLCLAVQPQPCAVTCGDLESFLSLRQSLDTLCAQVGGQCLLPGSSIDLEKNLEAPVEGQNVHLLFQVERNGSLAFKFITKRHRDTEGPSHHSRFLQTHRSPSRGALESFVLVRFVAGGPYISLQTCAYNC